MKVTSTLRTIGLLVLLIGVYWFFAGEIQRHWNELSRVHLDIQWQYIVAGALLVIAAYLVATLAWQDAIWLASNKKLTFVESIGLVNISQLTKYLPGKVWSYAIQMHLLASHTISKTCVLSINITMLLSLITSAAVIGLGYITFASALLPREVALPIFTASLVCYALLVFGGSWSISLLVRLINTVFRKNLEAVNVPLRGMIFVHGLNLVSNLCFGVAGYFIAVGIGIPQGLSLVAPITAASLLSDTIGFFAFVVPGGLGVREGVMYAMLKSAVDIQTCFILPVAFRLVTMMCDLLLGGLAMVLLHRFAKNENGSVSSRKEQGHT